MSKGFVIPMSIEEVKATTMPPEVGKLLTVSKYKALGFDLRWLDMMFLTYVDPPAYYENGLLVDASKYREFCAQRQSNRP